MAAAAALALGIGIWLWNSFISPTKIAFVNYQAISLGQISKANDNSFVKISELGTEELDRVGDFDMVFVNGMGLRITDEQRQHLLNAVASGAFILTTSATNPQNQITSVDSVALSSLSQYLVGGRNNYRNMLAYVRRYIDGKKLFTPEPEDPVLAQKSLLYYPSDHDELQFASVSEYDAWLKKNGKWHEDSPRIILTGQMGVPDSLVAHLERSGNIVYPVTSFQPFIAGGHADSISASAVINMAHGRLGDMSVAWLKSKNIPLFAPLNANRDHEDWLDDKMGMSGGFLSQSVVMPEIDGAVLPYTLFAHFEGSDGLPLVEAIPGRIENFVSTVNNYISLSRKPNKDKKIAIFYFKGPGQSALVAEGMEVAPSLFNLLTRLRSEGYNVSGLPTDASGLERLIAKNGRLFNDYAVGAKADFIKENNPVLISEEQYNSWCSKALSSEMRSAIDLVDGSFPGHGMSDADANIALACLRFGNIALIPQPSAGLGDDDFKIVHGTDQAPPHNYVAAYLWSRLGFGADALIHFGAHGSLEFTPHKQVALSSNDWPDRLVGTIPHFYIYSTSNVGEAMNAKRRSYAGILSYLTPPFAESDVRGIYNDLTDAIEQYNSSLTHRDSLKTSQLVKKHALSLGIHRDLRIDSLKDFTSHDISRIETFAEELANEKISGAHYVLGQPYSKEHIRSTLEAMTLDPIAYSIQKLKGGSLGGLRALARIMIENGTEITDDYICNLADISQAELDSARTISKNLEESHDMLSRMMLMGSRHHENMKSHGVTRREYSADELEFAQSVSELEKTLKNIGRYRRALYESPQHELSSIVNALNGGYISPASGGDPVRNPSILPTGRNMYSINAEETPSATAWERGKILAKGTIDMFKKNHNDSLPRKVSYTLWSSEFIETEGATIAQILYMLGVRPVYDPFGRVTDLKLIPSQELGRSRIDVVVQTSGQLRDLAASRLFLIDRAVRMAAEADDDVYTNYVAQGLLESEKYLVVKGFSPKEARELSAARVFGGINGNYGTGIQQMVESGDRWDAEGEIAAAYINNMGASYGSEQDWQQLKQHAFEAAITRTDAVVQPRQSNTWGPLSLDHVYEFMGGMNLAVRNITGKDPDAFMSDYRNRNKVRIQELKEAIGVECRTTILNPAYIKEKMKGGSGDAATFAETITNTYGWNVMKPDVIDNQLWDGIYDTYISDCNNLGIRQYFEDKNPAAMQEFTAVMLETARKGMWQASADQIKTLATVHAELIDEYGAACSGFVCDNAKLRDFISSELTADLSKSYNGAIAHVRSENVGNTEDAMVMKKDEISSNRTITNQLSGTAVAVIIAVLVIGFGIVLIKRRQNK